MAYTRPLPTCAGAVSGMLTGRALARRRNKPTSRPDEWRSGRSLGLGGPILRILPGHSRISVPHVIDIDGSSHDKLTGPINLKPTVVAPTARGSIAGLSASGSPTAQPRSHRDVVRPAQLIQFSGRKSRGDGVAGSLAARSAACECERGLRCGEDRSSRRKWRIKGNGCGIVYRNVSALATGFRTNVGHNGIITLSLNGLSPSFRLVRAASKGATGAERV